MRGIFALLIALCIGSFAGCVTSETHEKSLGDLKQLRAQLAEEQASLADAQSLAAKEKEALSTQVAVLDDEKAVYASELNETKRAMAQVQSELDATQETLGQTEAKGRTLEHLLSDTQNELQEVTLAKEQFASERDQLQAKSADLHRRLETSEQQVQLGLRALAGAEARIASLDSRQADLETAMGRARDKSRDLDNRLAAERENVARANKEKQQLMTGTTTAQEEIARLQRRAGELEARAALVGDLQQRLSEKDQDIGTLREATADRESLVAKNASLSQDLEQFKARVIALTAELSTLSGETARVRQDRDRLVTKAVHQEGIIQGNAEVLARLREERQALEEERSALEGERGELEAQLQAQADSLTAKENKLAGLESQLQEQTDNLAGKERELLQLEGKLQEQTDNLVSKEGDLARLEQERASIEAGVLKLEQERAEMETELQRLAQAQGELTRSLEEERAAKEAEIARLQKTQTALNESLEAEIAKGDIRIQRVRDRLTINLVDRVLFDSGQAQVKKGGLEVLQRVSDILKGIDDKQFRIEGHTDDVPIGVKLQEKFPTNWELSAARATSVVRFLIDKGGVNPEQLTAAGHADTQPVADNGSEEGRLANRRIEIVLYPRDLKDIVKDIES